MQPDQKRYLQDQLRRVAHAHEYPNNLRHAKPPAVRKAQAILAKYERDIRRRDRRRDKKVTEARNKVAEVILFGTVADALKALHTFERRKF